MLKKYFLIMVMFLGLVAPSYRPQAEMNSTEVGVSITRTIQPLEQVHPSNGSVVVVKKNLPSTNSKSSIVTDIVGGLLIVLAIVLASVVFLMRATPLIQEEEKEHV